MSNYAKTTLHVKYTSSASSEDRIFFLATASFPYNFRVVALIYRIFIGLYDIFCYFCVFHNPKTGFSQKSSLQLKYKIIVFLIAESNSKDKVKVPQL